MTTTDGSPFERTMAYAGQPPAAPRSSPTEAGHYLVVLMGNKPGLRVEVGEQPLTIGRDAGCGLTLDDSQLSRQHCSVALRDDAPVLTDLGSTNGTFVAGRRVTEPCVLAEHDSFTVGGHILQYERRNKRRTREAQELDQSLEKASRYVHSLLPAPLRDGPIRTEWFYLPCARLAGDAFGYFDLDAQRFAVYIVDVAGHGVGAAMHSVSLLNVLRQRALPETDLADPGDVLRRLNRMFPMEQHDGMYFTMWYGVYDRSARRLAFASGGHHPGFLVSRERTEALAVHARGPLIGVLPDRTFASQTVAVAPGSTLYLFSDGAFEIVTGAGHDWSLDDFRPLLLEPPDPALTEPERLHARARSIARPGPPEDDVSILTVSFR